MVEDINLLIQFVHDQGFDQPDLVEAADRITYCLNKPAIPCMLQMIGGFLPRGDD